MKSFREVFGSCNGHAETMIDDEHIPIHPKARDVALAAYKCAFGASYCSSLNCPRRKDEGEA